MNEKIEIPCVHCGTLNRVEKSALAPEVVDRVRCGKCGDEVLPDAPVAATDASFTREVERYPLPVLVDFWAPWCGPCRMVAPVLEELAGSLRGRVKIVKVNVDENPRLAAEYGIRSIPTMMLFRGPLLVDQLAGALPAKALRQWIETRI
ncbi:MAG: thioredoxin TrxC [Mariprofundaceae bacterium]